MSGSGGGASARGAIAAAGPPASDHGGEIRSATSGQVRPVDVEAPLRVRDVIAVPAMKASKVLAGAGGLDREVMGANIIEVPDVRRWLKGGEFLFSAGYPWREAPEGLTDLIVELDEIGVAGIGLKLGAYVRRVSREVLTAADELGFPLIQVPPTVAYMEVIEPVFQRLAAGRLSAIERSLNSGAALTSLGLDDQSVEAVAGALAKQVRNPVHVFDLTDGSVVVSSPEGRVRRRQSDEAAERLRRAVAGRGDGRRPKVVEVPGARALVASLVVGRRDEGYLVVLEQRHPLDEFAHRAVGHVAEVISFLLMKRMAVDEGRREAAALFLDSLMSGSLTAEEASERAHSLDLRLSSPHVALVIGLSAHTRDRLDVVSALVSRAFDELPHVVVAISDGKELLVLVEPGSELLRPMENAVSRLEALADAADVGSLRIGAGAASPGLEGVRRSRSEAMIAYTTAQRVGTPGLVRFEDLGVERLLAQIPHDAMTDEYVRRMLGPVVKDPELLRTLEVFLEHGGNKVASAAAMPLHRSSLMYRLSKISRLLGVDLDDPERFLELSLAVRLRRMLP